MKWKPIEPNRGDFITEIPDNMIAWAAGHNMTVRGKVFWHFSEKRLNP